MSEGKINPVLMGVVDTFVGVELIRQSAIPHRNRLMVILIDSAFETACRAYLQYVAKIKLSEPHRHRDTLVKTVKAKLSSIDEQVWNDIDYYYNEIRSDFYHQSAGKTITDITLLDYKDTVEFVINEAFGVKIDQLMKSALAASSQPILSTAATEPPTINLPLSMITDRVDRILMAVSVVKPQKADDINDFFKKQGIDLRLKPPEFLNVVGRNSGSKKLFYFDKELKAWTLSGLGQFRLSQLQQEVTNA